MKSLSMCVFAGLVILSSISQARDTELIVRFRDPQNTKSQAAFSALRSGAGLNADVKIVNREQGVVSVKFSSLDDAKKARERFEKSERIVNISPNHLYQPALSYRIRDAAPKTAKPRSPLLALPLALLSGGEIPDVLMPPTEVKTGNDPLVSEDWAMKHIKMNEVSDVVTAGNLITAVIDTGIDYNHEDLIGAMWRKPDNSAEVGYDFAHDNAKPYDVVHYDVEGCLKDFMCRLGLDTNKYLVNPGHGTHCAGHVAAVYNNSLGIRGVGAQARVIGLKFFYDYGEDKAGQGDDVAAIQSIDYAIKNGAKVISASWGGRINRAEAEKSELKEALIRAQKAGVLVVIAAGNDTIDQDKVEDPDYPAAYDLDNLIVVAAIDKNDTIAEFSNWGQKSVHIAAPGVKILSTTVGSKYSDVVSKFKDPQGRERQLDWDGTSMATPIVAGAAALVWSKYPKADYHEIRDRILRSARKVPGLETKLTTGGVLDVAAALR